MDEIKDRTISDDAKLRAVSAGSSDDPLASKPNPTALGSTRPASALVDIVRTRVEAFFAVSSEGSELDSVAAVKSLIEQHKLKQAILVCESLLSQDIETTMSMQLRFFLVHSKIKLRRYNSAINDFKTYGAFDEYPDVVPFELRLQHAELALLLPQTAVAPSTTPSPSQPPVENVITKFSRLFHLLEFVKRKENRDPLASTHIKPFPQKVLASLNLKSELCKGDDAIEKEEWTRRRHQVLTVLAHHMHINSMPLGAANALIEIYNDTHQLPLRSDIFKSILQTGDCVSARKFLEESAALLELEGTTLDTLKGADEAKQHSAADHFLNSGLLYFAEGDVSRAKSDFESSFTLLPSPSAAANRAICLLHLRKVREGVDYLVQLVDERPALFCVAEVISAICQMYDLIWIDAEDRRRALFLRVADHLHDEFDLSIFRLEELDKVTSRFSTV